MDRDERIKELKQIADAHDEAERLLQSVPPNTLLPSSVEAQREAKLAEASEAAGKLMRLLATQDLPRGSRHL